MPIDTNIMKITKAGKDSSKELQCGISSCASKVTASPGHRGLSGPLAFPCCPKEDGCKGFTEGAAIGKGQLLVHTGSRDT